MSTELSKDVCSLTDSNINFRIILEDFEAGYRLQSPFQTM